MGTIEEFYDQQSHHEWERLNRHRTEFEITLRILNRYLPQPPASIIDFGGGPGRYSIEISRLDYDVTLVDISAANLALARQKAYEAGVDFVNSVQADAIDLSEFPENLVDAALLMGPLYHLTERHNRARAVREAYRLLKPDGLIFATFITRYAPLRDIAQNDPMYILERRKRFESIVEDGVSKTDSTGQYPDFYFSKPDEIKPFMKEFGFACSGLFASEGVIAAVEEKVNELEGAAHGKRG